jgi:hypothetical protein
MVACSMAVNVQTGVAHLAASDMQSFALQADKLAHGGGGHIRRSIGTAAGYLLNRLPAAAEAALSHDTISPGAPHLQGGNGHITLGECAATAARQLTLADSQ